MKVGTAVLLAAGLALTCDAAQAVVAQKADKAEGDKTIGKVVKLLEEMLETSKTDGEKEKKTYAKFKCYCDQNKEEKTATVAEMSDQIKLLGSKIEDLQGSSGVAAMKAASIKQSSTNNEQARAQAESLRNTAHDNFVAEESDMTAAIEQLGQAVDVLAEISGDQSLQASAAHTAFMANAKVPAKSALLKLKTTVKDALLAAKTFLQPKQRAKVDAFLQAQKKGSSSAASKDDIVGILKQMKETFATNLEEAKESEAQQTEAHDAYMKTMTAEHDTLSAAYEKKQELLSANDGELASKREQLASSMETKADAEAFLEELIETCDKKAKDYEDRKMLRVNEEAAIAEAVAILDSDAAFSAFGKVGATSTGATGFLQLHDVRRHGQKNAAEASLRLKVRQLLEKGGKKSKRLHRIALLIQAGNPFKDVFEEIDKMKALIDEEAKLDKEQKEWCEGETSTNEETLEAKKTLIDTLEGEITDLVNSIEDPETGLKRQIKDTEVSLDENSRNQAEASADRKEAHGVFKKTLADADEAASLLQRAVKVLKKFYAAQEKMLEKKAEELLQKKKEEPAPPEAEFDMDGQKEQGGKAIEMIEFVLEETKKEAEALKKDEEDDVTAYEDTMKTLKEEEETLQTTLVDTKKTLVETELELEGKREDLSVTTHEKEAIEDYLDKIKPGCDFIKDNYEFRETARGEEMTGLDKAVELLKETPQFKLAAEEE